MAFNSVADFLAMGGYGGYVWSAFAITFGLMVLLVLESKLATAKLKRDIIDQHQREQRIANAKRQSAQQASNS